MYYIHPFSKCKQHSRSFLYIAFRYPGIEIVTVSFPLYKRFFRPVVVPFSFPQYLVDAIHLLVCFLEFLLVEITFDDRPFEILNIVSAGFCQSHTTHDEQFSVQFGVKPYSNIFFSFKIRTRSPILNVGFASTSLSSRRLYNASYTC